MKSIYLSGPIARCTVEEIHGWRDAITVELGDDYNIINPARRTLADELSMLEWPSIVATDKTDIDNSDIVIANVWKPSHGTSMEILYAWERGKTMIAIAAPELNHGGPWVHEHSHGVAKNIIEAIQLVYWLTKTPPTTPLKHQNYSAGYMFDASRRNRLAMIRKARPTWQAGKLNGIGGHCEPGESPLDCMVREFFEETGYQTMKETWDEFCTLKGTKCGETYAVHTYRGFGDIDKLCSMTDEPITIIDLDYFDQRAKEMIPNVPWLINMARYDPALNIVEQTWTPSR